MAIQQVVADVVTGTDPALARVNALRVMADSTSVSAPPAIRIRELPATWTAALRRALADPDDTVVQQAVAVTRGIPAAAVSTGQLEEALLEVAREPSRGRELRVLALSALPDAAPLTPDLFDLLSSSLQLERSSPARATAADIVGRHRLTREQLRALLPALASASATELPRLIAPFGNESDEGLGLALLDALDRSQARAALRADALRPRLAKYPESVRAAGEKLLASLHVDAASQARRLESLLGALPGGDSARGQQVFNGARGGCLACHQIGYVGGRIGPDLTRIGQVRGDRDLLESIIYPSVSFARGYEPVVVRTTAGDTVSGVQRLDEGDEVVLADVTGKETRISAPHDRRHPARRRLAHARRFRRDAHAAGARRPARVSPRRAMIDQGREPCRARTRANRNNQTSCPSPASNCPSCRHCGRTSGTGSAASGIVQDLRFWQS